MAKRKTEPRRLRTLAQVRQAFTEEVRRYWCVCIDSGGHFLRYVGPNPEGMEPPLPFLLDLEISPNRLLVEALELAGIPAQQA